MKYLAILIISVISLVNADGDYVPRAVYFIDENGNPSVPHPINSALLNRVRRQIQPIQPFGGFAFPQPVFNFPQIQPGQSGQSSFVSSSLASRFGEDEPVVTGHTQTIHSSGGKYQQTNTILRPDGTVQTNKQTGRVKRQTSQIQSQGNESGNNQFQSQNKDTPGGTQFQAQNQPGLSQTQGQGDSVNPEHFGDRAQNSAPQQPQSYNQGGQPSQQGQPNYPQQQQPQHQQQQPQHQQQPQYQGGQQQQYPGGQQQQQYPGGQPQYPVQFPFGFGGFAPGFGFPQQPGFGFGFPQFGGFQPGFPMTHPGVPQPAFGGGQNLDNRFGEDEPPTVVGGTQTITSQNGVFHATSSILKPDGQVVTSQHSGHQRG